MFLLRALLSLDMKVQRRTEAPGASHSKAMPADPAFHACIFDAAYDDAPDLSLRQAPLKQPARPVCGSKQRQFSCFVIVLYADVPGRPPNTIRPSRNRRTFLHGLYANGPDEFGFASAWPRIQFPYAYFETRRTGEVFHGYCASGYPGFKGPRGFHPESRWWAEYELSLAEQRSRLSPDPSFGVQGHRDWSNETSLQQLSSMPSCFNSG